MTSSRCRHDAADRVAKAASAGFLRIEFHFVVIVAEEKAFASKKKIPRPLPASSRIPTSTIECVHLLVPGMFAVTKSVRVSTKYETTCHEHHIASQFAEVAKFRTPMIE